jgi:mono/diheme cytochrome c family protein
MTRRLVRLAVPACVVLPGLPFLLGGWATTTVEDLPDYAVVGQPLTLTFTVRQHGLRPLDGLTPRVEALGGRDLRRFSATKVGSVSGRYMSTVTIPRAGNWIITIHSGFGNSRTTLMPLAAISRGSRPPSPLSDAEQGRRLFAAKGCFTCHVEVKTGPDLFAKRYTKEYVSQVVANPASVFAGRQGGSQMPNLNLKPREIAALAAYVASHQEAVGGSK